MGANYNFARGMICTE